MSTRVVRSIADFLRHRMDVDVICYCGHSAVLDAEVVHEHFSAKGWCMHLEWAAGHFRCSKCGSAPRHVGPGYR